jgi:hypothetical protein
MLENTLCEWPGLAESTSQQPSGCNVQGERRAVQGLSSFLGEAAAASEPNSIVRTKAKRRRYTGEQLQRNGKAYWREQRRGGNGREEAEACQNHKISELQNAGDGRLIYCLSILYGYTQFPFRHARVRPFALFLPHSRLNGADLDVYWTASHHIKSPFFTPLTANPP